MPKGGGVYRVGQPYTVAGRVYVPEEDTNYSAVGMASWYGDDFHGRYTANGEIFDMHSISAAHPTLPLPSYVRVTNMSNSRSIVVRVNDRGPYARDRLIDVSIKTGEILGFLDLGVARESRICRARAAGSMTASWVDTLREAPDPWRCSSHRANHLRRLSRQPPGNEFLGGRRSIIARPAIPSGRGRARCPAN